MATKRDSMVTNMVTPTRNVNLPLITWSYELKWQTKPLYTHYHSAYDLQT